MRTLRRRFLSWRLRVNLKKLDTADGRDLCKLAKKVVDASTKLYFM